MCVCVCVCVCVSESTYRYVCVVQIIVCPILYLRLKQGHSFSGASHFLVKFEVDECLCVVTRKVVVDPDLLNVGDGCQVKWNGSELLTATVIDKGDKASMEKAEEEHLASLYEKEEATTELPPPPKKTKRSQCRAKENKTRTPHRKLITTRKPLAQIQKVSERFPLMYNFFIHCTHISYFTNRGKSNSSSHLN